MPPGTISYLKSKTKSDINIKNNFTERYLFFPVILFLLVISIMEHSVTVSKDRTSLFDRQIFTITQETGKILRKWLDTGAEVQPDANDIRNTINRLYRGYMDLFGQDAQSAQAAMQRVTGGKASKDWTDEDMKKLTEDLALRTQKKGVMDSSEVSA